MTTQNSTISQTRSFSTVFMIEMWERFGFYGMQVLMVTYMMKKLGFVGRGGGAHLRNPRNRRMGG